MYTITKSLLTVLSLITFSNGGLATQESASYEKEKAWMTAPTATAEEAKIKHWRMPDIGKTFWDITELETAYINASPETKQDGIVDGELAINSSGKKQIVALAKEMANGTYGNYDSLLISHRGITLFESYFKRGRVDLPHPQSSAGKAYIGLTLGRAIQLGYLDMNDLDQPIISFFDALNPEKFVDGVETITLRKALTMRGGLRLSDEKHKEMEEMGAKLKGQAFVQYLFENSAAVTSESQEFAYGNFNPTLVLHVVDAVVPGSVWTFIENELLQKMDITNYDLSTNSISGLPDQWSLTSRDMLKIGLLAQNKGNWEGSQLVPEDFIVQSTGRAVHVGDDDIYGGGKDVSNQGYGYYWWATDLHHGEKKYYATSAQGGGGMYILLIEDLELVIVTTAHHREDKTQQLIAERILPAFVSPIKI